MKPRGRINWVELAKTKEGRIATLFYLSQYEGRKQSLPKHKWEANSKKLVKENTNFVDLGIASQELLTRLKPLLSL